jgi:hypothetical protein
MYTSAWNHVRRIKMSKTWAVWVDVTHRIEVEADDMDDAREQAINITWNAHNAVHCTITPELLEENDNA